MAAGPSRRSGRGRRKATVWHSRIWRRRQPVAFGSLRYSATRRAGGTRTGSSLETCGPPKAGVRNRFRRISSGKTAAAPFSGARAKPRRKAAPVVGDGPNRSEEHTSELQSLMRNSYAVVCFEQKIRRIQSEQKEQQ